MGNSAYLFKVTMRDMIFKNLTSADKKKRVLWASETINEDGILTRIHKYLIYIIKEVEKNDVHKLDRPEVFVIKNRNNNNKTEKFQIKMKGGLFCTAQGKFFFINFCHTLKIDLCKAPEETHL